MPGGDFELADQAGLPMSQPSFYEQLKDQQVLWVQAQGIGPRETEADRERPWVLSPNIARSISGMLPGRRTSPAMSTWACALTSSQCFAVNLFAPLAADPARARQVIVRLRPDRALAAGDTVEVALEFTPPQAPGWLGEHRRATQVDAASSCGGRAIQSATS